MNGGAEGRKVGEEENKIVARKFLEAYLNCVQSVARIFLLLLKRMSEVLKNKHKFKK